MELTLTKQTYSLIKESMQLFNKMPSSQTVTLYFHIPDEGWFVTDMRTGQTISLADFLDAGYPATELPQIDPSEYFPEDALDLREMFSTMHRNYLEDCELGSRPKRAKHTLTLIDGKSQKPLKYDFVNHLFD